jgi:hypothetical protein
VVLSAADFRQFLDAPETYTPSIDAISADDEGNLYISNGTNSGGIDRRGLYRFDTEGRLSKVVSYAERDIHFTGEAGSSPNPNSNILRMNPRTYMHPAAGEITQIIYAESSPVSSVGGANVFKPGDFDRDGDVAAGDFTLFAAALKTRGTTLMSEDDYKFDLNGNSAVDWKDVKVLQQFALFPDGDVNFDNVLDLVDLDVLGANYYTTASPLDKTWLAGDLGSADPLYASTAADANVVDATDLSLFADAWLNHLDQPIEQSQLTSRGYQGQFLADVLAAFGFAAGDFDAHGDVDGADFLDWQQQLGSTVAPGAGADANDDAVVDELDLAAWRSGFGDANTAASAASVPEPAAGGLAALVLAILAAGRRRTSQDRYRQ